MRAKEFLLEYSQAKTAMSYGDKLLATLERDTSFTLPNALGSARAYLQQKKKIGLPLEPQAAKTIVTDILKTIEGADPTTNKQYTQWLTNRYTKENVKLEDLTSLVADNLYIYWKLITATALPLQLRDINKLTLGQLRAVVTNPEYVDKLFNLLQVADKAIDKGQSREILNNAAVRIIVPEDITASKYYGQGTQWCTAARNGNRFEQYNKDGPLIILLPKVPKYEGEKYQLHFESGSCMDEQDEPADILYIVNERFGHLQEVLTAVDPNINKFVVFADNALIDSIIKKIREYCHDWINEQITEWEDNDSGYYEHLQAEYTDSDGDIDWESAPSYLDYSDEARELYNMLVAPLETTANNLKRDCKDYAESNDDTQPLINDIDSLMAWEVDMASGVRGHKDLLHDMARWIQANIYVDMDGSVHNVIHERHNRENNQNLPN
jgi:hypothetical protein